jgi:hypothetical protein
LLVGLITGLLGVLFGVLTVAAEKLPAYLNLPGVRGTGVAAVAFWLGSLLCGLVVVLPFRWQVQPGHPQTEHATFEAILGRKAGWLLAAVIGFALGVIALAIVLIVALLAA